MPSSEPAVTEIEAKIRRYILTNLMFADDSANLPADASLLEQGIIDSTGVLEIALFIEETFATRIRDAEMLPENFDSVANLTRFVARKLAA